jgi:hypothetical protein
VLARGNNGVDATFVETSDYRVIHRPITSRFKCIGANAPRIVAAHYLRDRDYTDKDCIEAVPEILAILKQACKNMEFVGEQEVYGFDVILFRHAEYASRTCITTEWASLTTEIRPIDGRLPQFTFRQFGGGGP